MLDKRTYTAEFFRAEVERIRLELTQAISAEHSEELQKQLAVARKYLAGFEVVK